MVDRSNALAAADRGSTVAVVDRVGETKAGSSGASVAADSTNRRAGEEQEESDGTMTEEKGQRDEREEERAPPGMWRSQSHCNENPTYVFLFWE